MANTNTFSSLRYDDSDSDSEDKVVEAKVGGEGAVTDATTVYSDLLTSHGVPAGDDTFFLKGNPKTIAKIINATERPSVEDPFGDEQDDETPTVLPLTACGGETLTRGGLKTALVGLWDKFFREFLGQRFFVEIEGRIFVATIVRDTDPEGDGKGEDDEDDDDDSDLIMDFVRNVTAADVRAARKNYATDIEFWFAGNLIRDLRGSLIDVYFTYMHVLTKNETIEQFFKPRTARDIPATIKTELANLNSKTSRAPACLLHLMNAIGDAITAEEKADGRKWTRYNHAGGVYRALNLRTFRDVDNFCIKAWRDYKEKSVIVAKPEVAFPSLPTTPAKDTSASAANGGNGAPKKAPKRRIMVGSVFAIDFGIVPGPSTKPKEEDSGEGEDSGEDAKVVLAVDATGDWADDA